MTCFTKRLCSIYYDSVLYKAPVFHIPWWRASQCVSVLCTMMACFTKHQRSAYHDCVLRKVPTSIYHDFVMYIPWCWTSQSVSVLYTVIACFTMYHCSIYYDGVLDTKFQVSIHHDGMFHKASVFYIPWWRA